MAGRNSKYETSVQPYLKEINDKIKQGVREEDIAKSLGISVASLNNYKLKFPELKEALSKDKGKEVLQDLINAGIKAAIGYYVEEETTSIIFDKEGNPKKSKVVTKKWIPANATLNIFYVANYGKDEGWSRDPLDYELKKAKQELDQELIKSKNWDIDV